MTLKNQTMNEERKFANSANFRGRLQFSPADLLTILKRKVLVSHLTINL